MEHKILLSLAHMGGNEQKYIKEAFDTNWVVPLGPNVNALDKGTFILAGITTQQVLQAVDTAVSMNANGDNGLNVPNYTDQNVSTKVVKLIQSYTAIINKMVYRKY